MFNRIIANYLVDKILKKLKGKKRWLVILVLIAVNAFASLGLNLEGLDLDAFVAELTNLLETTEG